MQNHDALKQDLARKLASLEKSLTIMRLAAAAKRPGAQKLKAYDAAVRAVHCPFYCHHLAVQALDKLDAEIARMHNTVA